jgi:hypothetical protein
MDKSRNPVILSVWRHRQNPLNSIVYIATKMLVFNPIHAYISKDVYYHFVLQITTCTYF